MALDVLLHRYSNIDYILRMPFRAGASLLKRAKAQDKEDRLFMQWCAWLPYMNDDRPKTFEEYADLCTGRNIDTRPTSDILAELGISLEEEVPDGA